MIIRIDVTASLSDLWEAERAEKTAHIEIEGDGENLPWDLICAGLVEAAIAERLITIEAEDEDD